MLERILIDTPFFLDEISIVFISTFWQNNGINKNM